MSVTSVRLAGAGDAGDADELAQRDAHVDVLEVVLARALDHDRLAVARPPLVRAPGSARAPLRYCAGERLRVRAMTSSGVPVGDDLAAVLAGARAQVDEVVGGAHHRLVVLDDQDRVAEVAQPLERARSGASSSAGCRPIDGSSQT